MAEPGQVRDNKVDQVQEYSDGEYYDGEYNEEEPTESQLPNSQFTAELNLLLVFLSLFTSTEESLNSVEKEQEVNKVAARAIKKLHTNRWEKDEVRPVRRQGQRLHTKIRDSRHGRRV